MFDCHEIFGFLHYNYDSLWKLSKYIQTDPSKFADELKKFTDEKSVLFGVCKYCGTELEEKFDKEGTPYYSTCEKCEGK